MKFIETIESAVGENSDKNMMGMQDGDVIVSWNAAEIDSPGELIRQVGATTAGEGVPVVVVREGKELTLTVTVAERPAFMD